MRKVQYSVYRRETGTAGGKAKNDAYDIAFSLGFEPSYKPSDFRWIRIIQQFFSIKNLKQNIVLLVQYPTISERLLRVLKNKLPFIDKKIVLVHDISSIQGCGGNINNEIETLNLFDCVIVHNKSMDDFLLSHGLTTKTVSLGIFDYLHDINRSINKERYNGSICIAGNLDKGKYIKELGKINKCKFNLYGPCNTLNFEDIGNIKYHGILNSNEIVYKLSGDYGLIWDGDSINSCEGIYGNYLLYNNPHKLSLYIASGKPVITWSKAAIAPFILKENIGIVVNSLEELNKIDLIKDYDLYKHNVLEIKKKIGTGYYLTQALNASLDFIK